MAGLLRPQVARLPAGLFLLAGVRAEVPGRSLAGGLVLIVASYGLAAVLNDLADVETDRANHRPRPLVTGQLTSRHAHGLAAACAAGVGLSQGLVPQPSGLLVTAGAVVIAVAYSAGPRVQRRGLPGHVLLAVAYLVLPLVLAAAQAPAPPPQWWRPVAVLVPTGVAALLYKDFKDEDGDRRTGKRTPLVRWGPVRTHGVATALLVAGAALGSLVSGPGWWLLAMAAAAALQRALAGGGGSLRWFRRTWYVACLLLVAGW